MAVHLGALVPQGWKGEFEGLPAREAFDAMLSAARLAETLGYDSVWLYDHFHSIPPPPRAIPVFECWTGMMALAQATERVRIGQMVTCAPYRNAAYLAKVSACIDVASNGRLEMGLGAGWYWDEFNAYGYGFPEPRERIGYLRDTVEILTRMWSQERATYEGRYASVKDAFCDPKPVQSPRPPIWVGGAGEKLTLRVTARFADYANFGGKPHEFARKRDILHEHCRAVGRDPAEITLTLHQDCLIAPDEASLARKIEAHPSLWNEATDSYALGHLVGTPERIVERMQEYATLGAGGFVLWFPDYLSMEGLELFAREVAPAVREIA